MASQQKLYLFGDQTFDIRPHFKGLLHYRQNPVLEDFLNKSYDVIRHQIYTLPTAILEDLPRFTAVDDLLLWDQSGKRCVPLDMAITCMYQLGIFIAQSDLEYPSASNARILGLCTGSLTASAVSCSRSTLDLVSLAVETVKIAFKTGQRVTDAAQRLEPASEAKLDQSWSMIVGGSQEAALAVNKFCEQTKMPKTDRPYISAFVPSGITVSGPPASLAELKASEYFKGLKSSSIPIYGPYHCPHLFSEEDVEEIVAGIPREVAAHRNETPILSSIGGIVQAEDFEASIKAAVGQILFEPIRWSPILEEVQSWLGGLKDNTAAVSFKVEPIGTTADRVVYNALKQTPLDSLVPSAPSSSKSDAAKPGPTDSNPKKPKLAIIGLSGRYPGAQDNEAFWNLLHEGLDVVKEVPALHWDAKTHVDPTGKTKNTSATPWGCWLDRPQDFDARFFNISPREAAQIDPAQRIALMTAYEAIEQAGIVPDATPSTRRDRVGVFYGVTSNDWMETNSAQNIDTYFIPGGNRAFIPGRINYCFKFSGPSYAVDTACSSSLAGIHIACNALWRGDIDTAIAGGTNVLTNPDFTAGLDRGHFLSRTGNCKTFDDEADGYCRGEGVGTVIIKRYEDAIADKDPIHGVILGAYTNHSAESESITRPHVGAQRAIFKKILNQAAVDPYDVGYVEMHGTGTQAGDAGEMSSVLETFAPPLDTVKEARNQSQALFLGSAKANIGHGEAVSGVTALIKALLMMKKNTIVPHAGIKTKINSRFPTDLDKRNVNIARKPTSWEREGAKPRRVFVNNFSAAGGNTALLIEDAPLEQGPPEDAVDPRTVHVVAVSAKNGNSLQGNLKTIRAFLQANPEIDLGQLSYTTTARRLHHQHRVLLTGSSVRDLSKAIEKATEEQIGMTRPKSAPRVLFTFTGNGAQYPGMGKQLYENFGVFRNEMRRLDKIGQSLGFPSVLPLIQSTEQDIGGFAPTVVQVATTILQISLVRLWRALGVSPAAVVGHSLGEYAALNVAGVLTDADTIYLVGERARLLEEKCTRNTHSMLVVKGTVKAIAAALKDNSYEVACINSPVETVLAGPNEDINSFQPLLEEAGMKSTLLKVPYAFHSSQVDPVLESFTEIARGVKFSKAQLPILCPLDGHVITDKDAGFVPEYFSRHCREPVNMILALKTAHCDNVITDASTTIEIGSHPACSGMVKANLPKITNLPSLQRARSAEQTITAALKTLYQGGADIKWAEYHRDVAASHKVLPLPAYSWDLKEFWMQYVNDWSLRKGDPPLVIESKRSKLESTTIHNIVEESGDDKKAHIVVEADINRKDTAPLVQGHEVDGIPLCTPSVYCDIALSVGTYMVDKYRPNQPNRLVDVSEMTISKALILNSRGEKQLLQAHVDIDWTNNSSLVRFMSFNSKGKLQEHSRCNVTWADGKLQKELQGKKSEIKKKMQALREGIAKETAARFNRPMVYRAIRPLARFHDDYRAIDEVVLDSNTLEATSKLSFGTVKKDGDYHTHPAIIDALTQSCGFTMNCNDSVDLDVEVAMNHGWGGFQIFEPIDFNKKYTTYTQMHEGQDKLWHGDVAVFDENDKIVASFKEIAIQKVPRRVLKTILSIEAGQKSGQKAAPVAQKPQPAQKAAPAAHKEESSSKKTAATPASAFAGKIGGALTIIAEESGIAEAELTDNTVFSDVGIDSLMALTISARFREELDVDLDFNSIFFEYPAVKDLKKMMAGDSGAELEHPATPSITSGSEADSIESSAGSQSEHDTGITTPNSVNGEGFDFNKALEIVAEESGVAIEELTDDTNFADSGVDSLLSLVLVSRLRDELELDIQHESLFMECPTVGDLRKLLCGEPKESIVEAAPEEAPVEAAPIKKDDASKKSKVQTAALAARKQAVDELVAKYTQGWKAPTPDPNGTIPKENEKVVLVTGASGSLGGHLAYHLAQLEDVKTVVCLNRENRTEPYTRQYKQMREKGIRFPENLKHKLRVFQTDTAKPLFGLDQSTYDSLVGSVTHLIHNAWPMSAKRALPGFESQFQVFRNLIDFAGDIISSRPSNFKFGFQMVSSIGVVGHYELGSSKKKVIVPEEPMSIDTVLPNGYGEAKWGCERMLDETLHKLPENCRTMAVRLGQIAGSKTSGYWNPMEHFGFLVKSSQTLNALPDLDGGLYWTPVNDIAGALSDLVLAENKPYPFYHIENPVGQSWKEMNAIIADCLHIPSENIVSFEKWLEMVQNAPQKDNPASTLLDFLDDNFLRMSCGGLVLDTKQSVEHSKILAGVGPVSETVMRKYIHIWREIGFLKSSAEDRARFDEERARLWGH
ncbi:Conidial yellow pigment biosynthesis polyketide synthase [Lecanosticta acicola]|uniref:Conidial yellow pigment biosynthesis polyketide synthase n=1 Tax=Lecanosticta acicola TaxID=111012 RepID=A0AAI9E8I7_9PEZI|nr:Conidial yellow pigment biosynthesis polyketide synthase [Lecanosticta acicola]